MQVIHSKDTEGITLGKAFGFVLRHLRQVQGLSQESLGFESGYHRTYISLLERGQKSPSLQTIFKLSKALRIEPAELIKHVESHVNTLLQKKESIDD